MTQGPDSVLVLSVFRRRGLIYMSMAEHFFHRRSAREKILLSVVLLFFFFVVYVRGVLLPLEQHIDVVQYQYRQIQHQAFELSSDAIRQPGFATFLREETDRGSLELILNETASAHNVRITNTAQEQDGVQIWVAPLGFNELLAWLNALREKKGVVVSELDMTATDMPGEVNVRRLRVSFMFKGS